MPLLGHIVPWYIDKNWPGVRPSLLGRTCWIDEQLRDSVNDDIKQLVILGSGYDCRAYRIPGITKAFELDYPSTLGAKKEHLTRKLGTLPGHVTYVPIDFDVQDISTELKRASFDQAARTFFIWEGVMHYLTAEAVDATFRAIAALAAPGSRLVFTYIHGGLIDGTMQFGTLGDVPGTLKDAGETWKFGLYPENLAGYLAERGLNLLRDVDSLGYRAKYMGPSGRHMKGFEFYHAAVAEVK